MPWPQAAPIVPGLTEHRSDTPSPIAALLAELMSSTEEGEGEDEGNVGSATRGRRAIRELESWAEADPRMAPKLSRIISDLIGLTDSRDARGPMDRQLYKTGGGDIIKTPV